ncbi:MAG TPA: NAD(P)-dependent glycerol-3-phosphate dehydrogenase [Candidatus Hydrogenedentes bacterium]|nr:NAD(P)-dependent glycerol-3-phosphate dehydrogenase [Candidatus Hydrogenedentota bacterium]
MKIQVLGGGAWGMALARLLAGYNHETHLWVHNATHAEQLRRTRRNEALLPGITLPETVSVTQTPAEDPSMAVYAIPSHALRETARLCRFEPETLRVSATKGIENDTLLCMSAVLHEEAPASKVAVLSGPSHAEEVARDLPACVVAAGRDDDVRKHVQDIFGGSTFRVYTSHDVMGVELGGALKNIIAIAAGACEGFGLGDNAKAALITRGLAEMIRLGNACGAEAATFAGLSGLGDLVATCSSRHSRNYQVGRCVARGMTLHDILASTPKVAEGIRTTKSAMLLARKHNVEMPITAAVYKVLYDGMDARHCITALMNRLMRAEWE